MMQLLKKDAALEVQAAPFHPQASLGGNLLNFVYFQIFGIAFNKFKEE